MIKIGSILIIISSFIFAKVTANVSTIHPTKGQLVTYDITAEGNNISFPDIRHINGVAIISTSSSSNLSIINGQRSSTKTKRFSFYAQKNMTIPRFIVMIDGRSYQTEEIKLDISKANAKHKDIELILQIDKTNVYLSEATTLRLFIKRRANFKIIDISLQKPSLADFWVKNTNNNDPYRQGDYIIQEISYEIYPQKIGQITISNFIITITTPSNIRNSFFFVNTGVQKQITSNSVNINVKDIPNGTNIVGDFDFKVKASKLKTKANDSISLEVSIKGKGNLEDIENFELNINNANSYASKPKIKGNTFKQIWSIVADENFTIPSIEFSFFSLKDEKIITKKSNKINIEITGKKKQNLFLVKNNKADIKVKIQEKKVIVYKEAPLKEKILYSLLGSALTIMMFFLFKLISEIISNIKYQDRLKIPKDDKELLSLLMKYKDNEDINKYIGELEQNIYNSAKNKINRKAIRGILLSIL
jgi:hypothetical protein